VPQDGSRLDQTSEKKEPDWMQAVVDTKPVAVVVKPLSDSG
jgi:hypothetical protein